MSVIMKDPVSDSFFHVSLLVRCVCVSAVVPVQGGPPPGCTVLSDYSIAGFSIM